jgi:hypothetical protein
MDRFFGTCFAGVANDDTQDTQRAGGGMLEASPEIIAAFHWKGNRLWQKNQK